MLVPERNVEAVTEAVAAAVVKAHPAAPSAIMVGGAAACQLQPIPASSRQSRQTRWPVPSVRFLDIQPADSGHLVCRDCLELAGMGCS
jgi:galactokinase